MLMEKIISTKNYRHPTSIAAENFTFPQYFSGQTNRKTDKYFILYSFARLYADVMFDSSQRIMDYLKSLGCFFTFS